MPVRDTTPRPPHRPARRLPPPLADLAVAVVVAVPTGADAAVNDPGHQQADAFTWLLLAVSVLALLVRSRWPLAVAAVTGAACAGWALYGHIGELLNLPVMAALYAVAVYGNRRRTFRVGAVAALASGTVSLVAGIDVAQPEGAPVLEMLWPLVPLLLGEVVRGGRELLREYADRAARAEREREREAERRVRQERAEIARELHDVVAHTVSAMTVQAGVALDALDSRPELARQALRQVRESGREAVRELRTTVSVLRDASPDGSAGTEPAPRLDQLPDLVAWVREAGVQVSLRCEPGADPGGTAPDDPPPPTTPGAGPGAGTEAGAGTRSAAGAGARQHPPGVGGLSPLVQLAAYRLVQEALTNVVRHANAQRVAVSVVRADDHLLVEVSDDGRPGHATGGDRGDSDPGGTSGGYGLLGMRERTAALGGTLTYGPQRTGGWRVSAALPLSGAPGDGAGRDRWDAGAEGLPTAAPPSP